MLCNNCGEQISDKARYCPSCGKKIIRKSQDVINGKSSSEMAESSAKENSRIKVILWFFTFLISTSLLLLIILSIWWGTEPKSFNVQEIATHRLESTNTKSIPTGFIYTSTLANIAEVLLQKPGGYLSNDITPPGMLLDNIHSWEYGALVILRDGTSALRNHLARAQSQSAEDPDLARAEPYFYYERNSWALPSTEAEYEKGIDALHAYLRRLANPTDKNSGHFHARTDNLSSYLEMVIKRLGGISTRLTANANSAAGTPDGQMAPMNNMKMKNKEGEERTPWLFFDDIFYEARGESWALLHMMQAIKVEFGDFILEKQAMKTLDDMILALENAITPTSITGSNFGIFANQSLSMAKYIARAHAAALDLSDLINITSIDSTAHQTYHQRQINDK